MRNRGDADAPSTTLRYYRSADAVIATGDTEVGTDVVSRLHASGTSAESINLTAPDEPGTYHYGACVDPVSGESDAANNCSRPVQVTVGAAPAPDLVVESPAASDSSPAAGARFELSATVRNRGDADAPSTTLRYYRSADAVIATGDTEVGTDVVSGLDASEHQRRVDQPHRARRAGDLPLRRLRRPRLRRIRRRQQLLRTRPGNRRRRARA